MNQYHKHWNQIESPDFSKSGPWSKKERKFKLIYLSAAAILLVGCFFFIRYEQEHQQELQQVRLAKQELLKLSALLNSSSEYLEPITTIHETKKTLRNE